VPPISESELGTAVGKRAVVLPGAETAEELLDLVARLSFYLAPARDWTVAIPTRVDQAAALVTPVRHGGHFRVPDGLDPRISVLHESLAGRVRLIDSLDEGAVRRAHAEADIVFVRDSEAVRSGPWRDIGQAAAGKRVYPVDRQRYRLEGSQYIQAVFANRPTSAICTEDSRVKFEALVRQLGHHPVAYLLATGPSIDRFQNHDFSDGLVIACNTTVLDDELLAHARPKILTFADPIFHFGCSLYAAEFRRAVRRAAQEHDFWIVIPIKYYELYTHLEPSLASRVVGLPYAERETNLDLRSDFEVKVTDNVATFMMLPLATTFATSVEFLGFDGRKPEEDYFWRHNPRTQLNTLMDNIKSVHPGFFDVQYEDYYDRHCDNLARYIEEGERLGKRFSSMEPSAIPALANRQRAQAVEVSSLTDALSQDAVQFRIFSLNPDWVDDFGHFGSYDERLAEAVDELGGQLVSVVNAGLESSDAVLRLVRCFTEHTWVPGRSSSLGDVRLFERELDALLAAYAEIDRETPTVFAMYVSSAWHLPSFVRLRSKYHELPWAFAPNMFHMHDRLLKADLTPASEPSHEVKILTLTQELRKRLGIRLYADSVRLQRAIHRHAGDSALLWPMFSTTLTADEAREITAAGTASSEPLRIYCPSNAQLAKGYDLLPELARAATDEDRRQWQLVTRAVVRPGTPSRLRQVADELTHETEALTGVLSPEQYLEAFCQAEVILLPYRAFPFASRTSAALSDAVLLGKPVVATSGTWAGTWVEQLGNGATFPDGDVDGMLQAVRLVSSHIDHYREFAEAAREGWAEQNSPKELASLLRDAAEKAQRVEMENGLLLAVQEMSAAVAVIARSTRPPAGISRAAASLKQAGADSRPGQRLLPLLRASRRSQMTRAVARRFYRVLPSRMKKPVDDLVRKNPG
jgi:glycosyltransferase involved in cell wall biosynthesis